MTEVSCRHALVPSSLPGLDYALNPYRGCAHGCAYCYAPDVLREPREWGTFVDVRGDMPAALDRDLKGKRGGTVGIGTVTDPYQPIEARFRTTRAILSRLLDSPLAVTIQTKSSLVTRDLDVLSGRMNLDVGITVTTLDEYLSKAVEPLASAPRKRLDAIGALADKGVDAWAFVGPFLPGLRGGGVGALVAALKEAGATRIMGDRLRFRPGTLRRMELAAEALLPGERASFLADLTDATYSSDIERELASACAKLGMEYRPAFPREADGRGADKKAFSF